MLGTRRVEGSWVEARQIVLSLIHDVAGLHFLHDHRVVHCDVKGGNILVSEDGIIKLADFNSSKVCN